MEMPWKPADEIRVESAAFWFLYFGKVCKMQLHVDASVVGLKAQSDRSRRGNVHVSCLRVRTMLTAQRLSSRN